MLFNSAVFLLFGACFYAFWAIARRHARSRWIYITVASLFFYGWWDYRFLVLIIASGLLDYTTGLLMYNYPKRRTFFLIVSLCGNLGSLAAFKYSAFLAANVDALLRRAGVGFQLGHQVPEFMLLLPVGISFYTFQSMSYTIDVYRGRLTPTRDPFHFFAYLSLFPQLVAGPIVRAADLLPQLAEDRRSTEAQRWEGMRLIVHGYFKKVVIADSFAPVVNAAFTTSAGETSGIYWWLVITLFAFQIYCDFSGYTDIARGLCRWMGYDIPANFAHPYGSGSLREFWQRWHISLSSWFRDYVYIPLGGSKRGLARHYGNLWAVMLISGLWHGAAWHFVAWGAIHALLLSVERTLRWPERLGRLRGGALLATIVCVAQVWIAWVFFRANSAHQALAIVGRMLTNFRWHSPLGPVDWILLAILVSREAYFWLGLDRHPLFQDRPWRAALDPVVLSLMLVASVYLRGPGHEFIYFQF